MLCSHWLMSARQFGQWDRFGGRGSQSGVEVNTRMYEVFTLREGKIVRMDEFTERATALEAAGLSE